MQNVDNHANGGEMGEADLGSTKLALCNFRFFFLFSLSFVFCWIAHQEELTTPPLTTPGLCRGHSKLWLKGDEEESSIDLVCYLEVMRKTHLHLPHSLSLFSSIACISTKNHYYWTIMENHKLCSVTFDLQLNANIWKLQKLPLNEPWGKSVSSTAVSEVMNQLN